MLLPGLSAAQESATPPANTLAEAVVRFLGHNRPGYARIDAFYEKSKATRGDAWARLPEAKAMFRVREEMLNAARSAAVETHSDGTKSVVYTQGGKKRPVTGVVPSAVEGNAAMRAHVADVLADFIVEEASRGADHQAVMAAIEAVENPPLPDIDRRAAPMVLGAFIEAPAPYPLWLPAPGPSSKEKLPPRAEEARQRGLKAAGTGDWPAAVASFKEANQFAHASPALMFNLALAYQRGGWPVQAAMYYRAYLAALPDAPNAAEVRAEIPKLIAGAEARALGLFDEAEHLADKLSATPAAAGAKSLRQIALEDMATYAYMAGLIARGDALSHKAASLPGAESTESKNNWDKHGLYGAFYSWDAKRVDDIASRSGKDYDKGRLASAHIKAYWMRGDLAQVRRLVDEYPSFQAYTSILEGLRHRSYDVLETLHARSLAEVKTFDGRWYKENLLSCLESAFWDGRPDVASRLASQAVELYRKFNLEDYRTAFPQMTASFVSQGKAARRAYSGEPYSWDYIVPNALLGERSAVQQEIGRWPNGYSNNRDYGDGDASGNAALLLTASLPAAQATALIEEMIAWRFQPGFEGEYVSDKESWPLVTPLAYFALAVAKGDASRALKYLGFDYPEPADRKFRTDEYYQKGVRSALRFAVATGRSQLALDLAERVSSSREGLLALNRLALNPGADASVRERVRGYAAAVSGGWRPTDANHARKVWLHLDHAMWLNDENGYGPLPMDAEKVANEKPERLPADLAAHATVVWMGAAAARLED
jgi:hypothetical protein